MKVSLKNIGPVTSAEIELNGLTVIAGENDSGKSTVGKALYAVVRAFSKYRDEFEDDRKQFLYNRAENIYFSLRHQVDFEEHPAIRDLIGKDLREKIDTFIDEDDEKPLLESLNNILTVLNSIEVTKNAITRINEMVLSMFELINIGDDNLKIRKHALQKVISSEFDNQISTYNINDFSEISAVDGNNPIFSLKLNNNKIDDLSIEDELFYNDVTYIETPFVLQMNPLLRARKRLGLFSTLITEPDPYPLHVSDLITSLYTSVKKEYSIAEAISDEMKKNEIYTDKISEIIGGVFQLKKETKEFQFSKNFNDNVAEFKLSNIATGIKSFGILQLLIEKGLLNGRNLLIIDEPEVNLHPKWQIKYAELLVLLSKELSLSVVITSHSPYFIEAIKVYSDKYNFSTNTRFYITEKNTTQTSQLVNITNKLEIVFEKLAEPFENLESEGLEL